MTTFQTNAPITPLRQRMQQDMVMWGLSILLRAEQECRACLA